jgi:hypothetical protein
MSLSQHNPADVQAMAHSLNTLQQLMQWELAVTGITANLGTSPTVQLQVTVNTSPLRIWLPAKALEDVVEAEIIHQLDKLQGFGVDTTNILDDYKATGQQILAALQNKKGVDKPADS